jgi:hypothetical protein
MRLVRNLPGNPERDVRVVRTVGIALAFSAGLASCDVCMPGESYRGDPPALSPEQQAMASRLRSHVVVLASDIGERNLSNYDGLERSRRYIAEQLREAGYTVVDRPYQFEGEMFHNLEALPPDRRDDPNIVIGAHYDSVEGSPGANDNASGVAALIELARLLRAKRLATPVRFVAFANEESPYFNTGEGMGSVEYVKGVDDPVKSIRFMLSLETVGLYRNEPGSQRYPPGIGLLYPDRGNFIAFVANPSSRSLLRDLVRNFRSVATIPSEGAALPASMPGVAWSDQRSFWAAGIPAVMVTDTAPFRDQSYHQASDTPERLDYACMTRLVEGLSHAVAELAGSDS